MVNKEERKIVAFELFKELVNETKQAYTFSEFYEAEKEKLQPLFTFNTFRVLLNEWQKEGIIEATHLIDKPTSILFSKQKFIPIEISIPRTERSWMTTEEKEKLREELFKQPDKKLRTKNLYKYIGSYDSQLKNLRFIEKLAKTVFHKTNQPLTSKILADFILAGNNESESASIINDNIKLAKRKKCFQPVFKKSSLHDESYFVPKDVSIDTLEDEWVSQMERRSIWNEEYQEKLKSLPNEKSVYQRLFQEKEYAVYLFAKFARLTHLPKKEVLSLKLSDIDLTKRTLAFSNETTLHLDNGSMKVLALWLKERISFPTSDSDYLFITKQKEKVENPATYMSVFRKYGSIYGYKPGIQYRDWVSNLLREKSISLKKSIEERKLFWFNEIEKA